ncbi:MAG TPA: stage II sporulation protein M [Candidatus Eisenbacteria bacterium]|nr:stage II sporulation protein M [Candidatus Eisenbacteria bacterium]
MDVDAYVAAHRGEWQRLESLVGRRGRLSGDEVDELVMLYQRVATHLSVVRSAAPDPALVGRLSSLVARARSAVTGSHSPAWKDLARFFTVVYPAALYRSARWWVTVGVVFCLVCLAVGVWVGTSPDVQATIATPAQVRQLVQHDFEDYYSSHPAGSFAAQVATNNAWVSALALALGVTILPVLFVLWQNALNVGVAGGLMAASGKLGLFFGLILPHGMLELTCVFVAAGAGLRLGWSWIDPGPRTRSQALAQEGLAAGALALGLACTLAVSGMIEAFVTPSGLPTWARVGIGSVVWTGFLAYVFVLGRRATLAGEVGDVRGAGQADVAPTAA